MKDPIRTCYMLAPMADLLIQATMALYGILDLANVIPDRKVFIVISLGYWSLSVLLTIFQLYIVAVSFINGGNQSTRRKAPKCP